MYWFDMGMLTWPYASPFKVNSSWQTWYWFDMGMLSWPYASPFKVNSSWQTSSSLITESYKQKTFLSVYDEQLSSI